jgi:hypothetical protein
MNADNRCEAALQSEEPERRLRTLVLDLANEGRGNSEIYALLENVLVRLRADNGPEEQEESILNVMDALTGWCHPAARLLAGDPSTASSVAADEPRQ